MEFGRSVWRKYSRVHRHPALLHTRCIRLLRNGLYHGEEWFSCCKRDQDREIHYVELVSLKIVVTYQDCHADIRNYLDHSIIAESWIVEDYVGNVFRGVVGHVLLQIWVEVTYAGNISWILIDLVRYVVHFQIDMYVLDQDRFPKILLDFIVRYASIA